LVKATLDAQAGPPTAAVPVPLAAAVAGPATPTASAAPTITIFCHIWIVPSRWTSGLNLHLLVNWLHYRCQPAGSSSRDLPGRLRIVLRLPRPSAAGVRHLRAPPREFVTCGHQGTLGFGYPTALGVKVAFPERPVVSVSGDGGFAFGIAELATAVQYGLGVVAVVFNNEAFGNVLLDQQGLYDGRELGARLRNPDFAAVAEPFGAAGYTVRTPEDLETTLAKALADGHPAVIEVTAKLGGTASPWKYLMPGPRLAQYRMRLASLPMPFGCRDQEAGYWRECSMRQVEVAARRIMGCRPSG
jgi:hypothetical protein